MTTPDDEPLAVLHQQYEPGERVPLTVLDYPCENCEFPYDQTGCRWRCPHCGWKSSCCEGAPQ